MSTPGATVFADVQTIGAGSNVIAEGDGYLWVVESLDNTVSRLDPSTGAYADDFIDVAADGNGRNPYDIYIDEEKHLAYVTNQSADTVSVASTQTGEIIDEIGVESDDFAAPQGVTASDDYIYVTNTHFQGRSYDEGSVTVIGRQTRAVVGHIPTARKNPSFARRVATPHGDRIVIVDTGALDTSGTVLSEGAVEIWEETDDPTAPKKEVLVLELTDDPRMGAPGRPVATPDGARLYLPSATAPVLFSIDLQRVEWLRDASNPLEVYQTDQKALHNATIDERGVLYLTAFNDDALYLVDTSCDQVLAGPIDVGTTNGYLEGPQDVAVVGGEAFFVMSISNAMGRVSFAY